MPNLLLKMMICNMMTAQEVTLRVRERIGSAPLYVSYQSEGRESAWMQKQLELGCRMFHITIDSRQMAELFSRNVINSLKYSLIFRLTA